VADFKHSKVLDSLVQKAFDVMNGDPEVTELADELIERGSRDINMYGVLSIGYDIGARAKGRPVYSVYCADCYWFFIGDAKEIAEKINKAIDKYKKTNPN
jgi:hypothetical protein